ncbi:MAG: hypothetical protein PVS3B3_19510 [Ktedonobacteraceae bacterium]
MAAGFKGQGEPSFTFMQAPSNQRQQNSPGFVGTTVDLAPMQHIQEQQVRNIQERPFPALVVPPQTPLTSVQEDARIQGVFASSVLAPLLPKSGNRSTGIGFGLASLCIVVAFLLLLFVYVMAQTLPQPTNGLATRLAGGSSLVAQNTPVIDLSPTPVASQTVIYPGKQYIANAQTASIINVATAQPTFPTTTFKVGQKIYITFDIHPNGHTGAICLLWFINATQFASYPFALNTTNTTSAYSYAATKNAGPGYIEIYWENAPSCIDPNKILSDHVNFIVTA